MYDTLVTLKKGAGRTLKAGGMWVYDNEIESIAGDFENGDIVTVHDFDGFFLGIGFINTRSKLTVRLLSRNLSFDRFILLHHSPFCLKFGVFMRFFKLFKFHKLSSRFV